jgi:CDP-glucose 4,6-dehydratase
MEYNKRPLETMVTKTSFNNIYAGKKVLITGNTGFKGSWLSTWLIHLGADVYGISKDIPTQPSMFEVLNLPGKVKHTEIDIRDLDKFKFAFNEIKPDFIFHLAAQAIVSTSYSNPIETLSSNIMGTANILETIRLYEGNLTAVFITSDKAYDNVEWIWGYRENDGVGGKDVYSGSKGGAELVIKSYWHSFIKAKQNIKLGIGRAGNVIGGGDWSNDRIVVDCMRAWNTNRTVELRCPDATRPWQHVLEPLSGYLALGQELFESSKKINGEAFNFGPRNDQNKTVLSLTKDLAHFMKLNVDDLVKVTDTIPFHEAGLLKLNCDKALSYLNWHATLDYEKMIEFIGDWYTAYYRQEKNLDMFALTLQQIKEYELEASKIKLKWAIN